MSVQIHNLSIREPLTELCEFLGVDVDRLAEMVIEPWGVTTLTYLSGEHGGCILDADTGWALTERQHFPATPIS